MADLTEYARSMITRDEHQTRSLSKAERNMDENDCTASAKRAELGELRILPGTELRNPASGNDA